MSRLATRLGVLTRGLLCRNTAHARHSARHSTVADCAQAAGVTCRSLTLRSLALPEDFDLGCRCDSGGRAFNRRHGCARVRHFASLASLQHPKAQHLWSPSPRSPNHPVGCCYGVPQQLLNYIDLNPPHRNDRTNECGPRTCHVPSSVLIGCCPKEWQDDPRPDLCPDDGHDERNIRSGQLAQRRDAA
jgi:hypothetical protein